MLKHTNTKTLFMTILSICLVGGLAACNQRELVKQINLPNPMDGDWLTPCLDMGGGNVNKIYAKLDSGKNYVAVLNFSQADCTGSYTMTDSQGNPISAPAYENDVAEQTVSGIPASFHAYKVTSRATSSETNIIFYLQGTTFTELINNFTSHSNWNDWLSEPDVAGFAAAPETYVPTSGSMVLQFSRGVLP